MKRKLVGILVTMLMIATAFSVAVTATEDNTAPYGLRFITTIGTRFNPAPFGTETEVKILAFDDEGHDIFAKIDWGDGTPIEWEGPYAPGQYHHIQHMYYEMPPGGEDHYTAQLWVIDDPDGDGDPSDGMQSPESPTTDIYLEDVPPLAGATIDGPDEGSIGVPVQFDLYVFDESGPRSIGIEFEVDGAEFGPKGNYQSETPFTALNTINELGEHEIRVRGWIRLGVLYYVSPGEWSDPFTINIINEPPEIPTITGPTECLVEVEYTYKVQTTDPDGQDVRYKIEWGDGTSEWTDYYESGQEVNVTKIWLESGEYDVIVKASDSWEETDYSDPITIIIGYIEIDIAVTGGIGIKTIITNSGDTDASDVSVMVKNTGGILGQVNVLSQWEGTITAGENVPIRSFIPGFGAIHINVTVTIPGLEPITKEYQAALVLFFVFTVREV